MTRKFKLYGEFKKVEENEDGTLTVSGIASSEAVDSDGEIITADAMKAAIPDYMAFGALREMHTSWAAGTAIKCEVNDAKETEFEALVVDAEAIKKVQTGTYKGFSIGGRITKKDPLNKNIITGIKLVEISLVDRPANPDAVFSMGKVEGDEPETTLGSLRKGLHQVANFADLLSSMAWIARDSASEAEFEGDDSPIPAALGSWVADGLGLLQAMTAEEIAELIALLPQAPAAVEVIAMADAGEDLEKKGAKFSAATAKALQEIHLAMTDCCGKLGAVGFLTEDDDDSDKVDKADKSEPTITVSVTDVPEVVEALQKAKGLADELALAKSENEALSKRVKELEALPEVAKGVAVVFSPEKQTEMFQKQAEDAKAADLKKYQSTTNPEERYLASIKFIHKYGHRPE